MSAFSLITFITFLLLTFSTVRCVPDSRDDNKTLPLASIFDQDTILSKNYANCFLIDNNNMIYYDFTDMKYVPDSKAVSGGSDEDFMIQTNEMNLYFNFCRNTNFKCNDTDSLITAKYKDDSCRSFTKPKKTLKEWVYYGDNSTVLNLKMESDIACTEYKNYSVYYQFICDPSMNEREFRLDNNMNDVQLDKEFQKEYSGDVIFDLCTKKINFVSKQACSSVFSYPMWKFYTGNVHIFGMFYILLGFLILFYGYRQESLTTYIFCVLIIVHIIYSIVNLQMISFVNFNDSLFWILTISEVVMGICMGYFLNNKERLKIITFGAFTGLSLFSILYYMFLGKLEFFTLLYYYCSCLIFCLVFGILSLALFKKYFAIIFSSSVCGAFSIIKGISMYAGGLPFEAYFIKLMEKKECVVISQVLEYLTITCYILAWAIFTSIGFYFQYKQKLIEDDVRNNSIIDIKPEKVSLVQN